MVLIIRPTLFYTVRFTAWSHLVIVFQRASIFSVDLNDADRNSGLFSDSSKIKRIKRMIVIKSYTAGLTICLWISQKFHMCLPAQSLVKQLLINKLKNMETAF